MESGPRYRASMLSVISDLAPNSRASRQESLLKKHSHTPFIIKQPIGALENYQLGSKIPRVARTLNVHDRQKIQDQRLHLLKIHKF